MSLHTEHGTFCGRRHTEYHTGVNVRKDANLSSIERFAGRHIFAGINTSKTNCDDSANDTHHKE
ncbi:hypothetical protein Ato02nite_086440 [Paractinoplanes toevensis]|uniref:Uncharacterized protein n=1 Tax=Paractinoplanes toevensis TaxID=571911 RepID=A0A919WAW5_9ACTN|nr:hypothetical protein Ato02nite_086440 [Actinoplanes toevensis]